MLSHQETMNPGTTLFIVIGVIGLMLYILKALRVSVKEAFTSEANGQISEGPLGDINSLLSSFGTPDLSNNKTPYITQTPDMTKISMPNVIAPEPTPSLSITAAVPAATAIPTPSDHVNTQAPIIPSIPMLEGKSQTLSDLQGVTQKKEAFETQKGFTEALDGRTKRTNSRRRKQKRIVKKCPPMPDMTLYIRKDQIPCWGCVLK